LPKQKKRDNSKMEYRYLELIERKTNEDGTIELSCSSETPVRRWWGNEILGHNPGEVNLERAKAVGSFLFAHGRDPVYGVMPLGPIVDIYLDSDRRVKAKCSFDADEKSQIMKSKVENGSIKGVSIGYKVNAWMEVKNGATVRGFTGPCDIAVDWEILEISLEPTAADPSVGVGRSESDTEDEEPPTDPVINETEELIEEENRSGENMKTTEQIAQEKELERAVIAKEIQERALEINALCRSFPDLKLDADEYIRSNQSLAMINADIIRKLQVKPPEGSVRTPSSDDIQVGLEDAEKFRAAAEDALMMRCGSSPDKLSPGANELRGYSLYDLASATLERSGEKTRGKDKREVAEKALFSAGERNISLRGQGTSDFPIILANVANKVLQKAYTEVPTTYQQWCQFADAVDFKEMSRPQFSEAADLDQINEGGEYKAAEFAESGEKYKILTYGKKFCVSRQTIINDDLSVISRIPALFGAAAARKVNALVYAILTGNPLMADGTALFATGHNNLAGTAAAITVDSLGKARAAMRKQKALQGKATLNIVPKFLIIPAQLELAAMQVIRSAFDPALASGVAYNPFTELTPIVDATLDESSLTSWFLAADPGQIDTVEVAFLNGQRTPYQEQRIGFDVDGLEMKVRIDVGCKALDYRGVYKNAGA